MEDGAGGSDTRTINVTVQNVSELSGIILADDVVAGHVPGLTGYLLHGIAGGDYAGFAVAPAGDVDGDGIADFLIGAPGADYATGETYLVLGGTANLAALDGDGDHVIALGDLEFGNGYLLKGLRPDDYSGWAVSAAGDVNADGHADFLIGAYKGGNDTSGTGDAGEAYLLFGGSNLKELDKDFSGDNDGEIDLADLDAASGYRFVGDEHGDYAGFSVAGIGDVNGDGYDDLLISAYHADYGVSGDDDGFTYLVFGGPYSLGGLDSLSGGGGDGEILLADLFGGEGQFGYVFAGATNNGEAGFAVSAAGDVDGDDIADLVIGAPGVGYGDGAAYLVFGGAGNLHSLDESDGDADGVIRLSSMDGVFGFRFVGPHGEYEEVGYSISTAGDVNGDGYDDLLIGAPFASPGESEAGRAYLVFGGKANLDQLDTADGKADGTIALENIDGATGYVIEGAVEYGKAGLTVSSLGDFNGDGYDDLIVGSNKYSAFVLFGGGSLGSLDNLDGNGDGHIWLAGLDGINGFELRITADDDPLVLDVSAAGDVNDDGYADILVGVPDDVAGKAYVIFGGDLSGLT